MTCFTDDQIEQLASSGSQAPDHLRECADCRGRLEAELRLARAIEDLPMAIEPPRDLWPGIERQVAAQPQVLGMAPNRWLQMAAAAAVLAFGVWIGSQWNAGSRVTTAAADQSYEDLAGEVDTLRRQLATLMIEQREQFDPATVAAVENTLTTLDEASSEFSRALEQDPENRQLRSMRASSTKREAHVLADLVTTLHGASMAGLDPTI